MSHATTQRAVGELPAEATPFTGRVTELAQLTALLTHARMVSVTGTGGVGKTRLALRAAAEVASGFTGGVYLAELAGLTDPNLLPHTIAAALGLPERDASTAQEAVLGYLRDRKALLVLDNCEHLIDACAELAEAVLQETAHVTLLATSRQPLDVAGENACPISPLRVPEPGAPSVRGDAVDFFARRAAAVRPGFTVTPENREDVTALCAKLDGIPLAIELATVRLRTLPLSELAQRMPLSSAGERGAGGRHATLGNAIGWSYGLCTQAEQALWQRLAAFPGSCTIEAIEEVCSGRDLPRDTIIAAIIGLVDKSVLLRDAGTPGGPARYRLLDTIREYGAGRLAESGQQAAVRSRLLRFYVTKARYFRDHFLDDDQLLQLREMRLDHANIRAALEFALDREHGSFGGRDQHESGAELAVSLYGYWDAASLHREGAHWLDQVLEIFENPSPERTGALAVRCALGATGGCMEPAISDGTEGIRLAAQIGDQAAGARARVFLAHALTFAGRYADSTRVGTEAARELTALGDRIGLMIQAANMAHNYQLAAELDNAEEWYRRGLELFGGATGERWLTGWLHLVGGYTFLMRGQREECAGAWRKALTAKYDVGDTTGIGFALEAFSALAALDGRYGRAAWLFGAAEPLWERAGALLSHNPLLMRSHHDTCARTRDALGAREFDALFARGANSPLPQIVTLTLEDSDGPPARPARLQSGDLTSREEEVAQLAATGLPNREIAERMAIAKRTVDAHVEHIYAKLGLSSRAELAFWLRQRC